jgi:hypothetical protein
MRKIRFYARISRRDPPQSLCSKDVTTHPHWPGARPGHPCHVPAYTGQPLPCQRRFSLPLRNRVFLPVVYLVVSGLVAVVVVILLLSIHKINEGHV